MQLDVSHQVVAAQMFYVQHELELNGLWPRTPYAPLTPSTKAGSLNANYSGVSE